MINLVKDNIKSFNKRLSWQIKNINRGLKFIKLDINTLQLLVFIDASFTNNKDLSLQIRYIIILANTTKKANIIYWSLVKYKRIIQSVLAFKLYSIAYGFNISTIIKSIINKILQVNLLLVLYTNFKSLYNCLI